MKALLAAIDDVYEAIKESIAIWQAGNEAEALERMRAGAKAMRAARDVTAEADAAAAKATDAALADPPADPK